METKAPKKHLDKLNNLYLFLISYLLIRLIVLPQISKVADGLAASVIGNMICLLQALIFCWASRISIRSLGFSRERIPMQIFWGVVITILFLVVFIGGSTLLGYHPSDYLAGSASNEKMLLLNLAFFLFIVGPVEEFMFRGYLLTLLTDITKSPLWGVLISSLLFGLIHWIGGNLLQVASTFFIGLVYAFSKQKIRNCTLLSVMIAHSLHNVILELIRWYFC